METLRRLFYDPATGYLSASKLYQKAKPLDPTITHKLVKEFLSNQETQQIHQERRKSSKQYPLTAYQPFARLQIDLLDVSNENPQQNGGTRYLFLAIDVYSRYAFQVPIKAKTEVACLSAFKTIIEQISLMDYITTQIDSDSEPAFKSRSFTQYCSDNKIQQHYSQIGDHASLGIVDRFCRTLRGYIAKYQTAHQTQRYIDVLPALLQNYNSTIHSTLKETPERAIQMGGISGQMEDQVAKASKVSHNRVSFHKGDQVRLLVKKQLFDKGTAHFTKSIHTILAFTDGLYYVSDRVKGYRKSEMLLITKSESAPPGSPPVQQPDLRIPLEELREAQQAERRQVRLQAKEGVERNTHTITEEEEKQAKKARMLRRRPVNHPFMVSH